MKKFYPAVFHEEDGGYTVTFPDIPGCVTEGDSLEEALRMARDAMGICLVNDSGDFYYPNASDPKTVKTDEESFCMLVDFDELEYLKNTSTKSVKKTLTIPEWMNEKAKSLNINFSKVLQDALLEIIMNEK